MRARRGVQSCDISDDTLCSVEDCLTLDVYTPSTGSASKLPVMFWVRFLCPPPPKCVGALHLNSSCPVQIYGGGWVEGDSYEKGKFSGVKMAKEHNVVVVAGMWWSLGACRGVPRPR